jgi:hypothetical protein
LTPNQLSRVSLQQWRTKTKWSTTSRQRQSMTTMMYDTFVCLFYVFELGESDGHNFQKLLTQLFYWLRDDASRMCLFQSNSSNIFLAQLTFDLKKKKKKKKKVEEGTHLRDS